MGTSWLHTPRVRIALALVAVGGAALVTRQVVASDHQDTPFVEFTPRFDINDVYAFPTAQGARVALVLGTSSPLTPANTPTHGFGTKNEELYQIKVDNTGDGVEDLVFQLTFTGKPGNQRVTLRGPVAPATTGTSNTLFASKVTLRGDVGQILGSASGIQLYTGPRDDPFFIDLEQFFRILPDRKPESGPLSQLPSTPTATSFRPAGEAVDFVRGINDLAIVIELPTKMLTSNGNHARFGVWATTSKARS